MRLPDRNRPRPDRNRPPQGCHAPGECPLPRSDRGHLQGFRLTFVTQEPKGKRGLKKRRPYIGVAIPAKCSVHIIWGIYVHHFSKWFPTSKSNVHQPLFQVFPNFNSHSQPQATRLAAGLCTAASGGGRFARRSPASTWQPQAGARGRTGARTFLRVPFFLGWLEMEAKRQKHNSGGPNPD